VDSDGIQSSQSKPIEGLGMPFSPEFRHQRNGSDGCLEIWLLANWFWEISLIASFFVPEVQKMQFSTFQINPRQPNAP